MIQKGKRYIRRANAYGLDKVVEVRHIDARWVEVVDDKHTARMRIPKERFLEFFKEADNANKNITYAPDSRRV